MTKTTAYITIGPLIFELLCTFEVSDDNKERKLNWDDLSPNKDHPVMTRIMPKPYQINFSINIFSGLKSVSLDHSKEIIYKNSHGYEIRY